MGRTTFPPVEARRAKTVVLWGILRRAYLSASPFPNANIRSTEAPVGYPARAGDVDRRTGIRPRRGAALAIPLVLSVLSAVTARPAVAQVGIFDALARRFSDVSFYASTGGLLPSTSEVRADRLTSYGIEVLVSIGSINRPTGPPVATDSVVLRWTGMQVVRSAAGVDTVHTYEVRPAVFMQPMEQVWSLELGLGYGQMSGFASAAPELDMRGAVRDLPTVSLYASYVPTGTYVGVRSGFMRLQSLQVYHADGRVWGGEAESFLGGAAVGQVVDLLSLSLFTELGYSWRPFPSIRWSGGPVAPELPRELSLNGWSVGLGVQFAMGGN